MNASFLVQPAIAAVNGKAEGSMTFLDAKREVVHCESSYVLVQWTPPHRSYSVYTRSMRRRTR